MDQQSFDTNPLLIERIRAGVGERILLLMPSPGAESVATALIEVATAAGARVRIVYLTDGIPRRKTARLGWTAGAVSGSGSVKTGLRVEAVAAQEALGIEAQAVKFHGFPHGRLTAELVAEPSRLYASVRDELRLFQPTIIVAPSRHDLHPDYNAVGMAAERAFAALRESSLICLAYTVHGDEPPSLVENVVRVPVDPLTGERKQHAAYRHRLPIRIRNFEQFVIVGETALDAIATEYADGVLRACAASRRLRRAKRLEVLPTDTYLHPASIRMRGRSSQVTLGSRASDGMSVDKTVFGLEFGFAGAHGPIWVKAASRRDSLDAQGWFPIQTLPRPGRRSTATCCMVHRLRDLDVGGSPLQALCSAFENVIVIDDGSNEGRLENLRRLSASSKTLHVIVQPTLGGAASPLLAAFRYALAKLDFGVLVTLDAERVHSLADIPRLVDALQRAGADIAIGVPADPASDTWHDRLANAVARGLLRLAYRRAPRNVQSGFRAYHRTLVKRAAECLDEGGEETEIRLLALASDTGRVAEVPVAMSSPQQASGSLVHLVWQVLRAIDECAKTRPARAALARHRVASRGL